MRTVAIIPARSGSKRIPNKNIKPFHGLPIIAYSIQTAKESGLFDDIYVSTDSGDIMSAARFHGAHTLKRPRELADDATGTQAVMQYHLQRMPDVDIACCIYPTAPLMSAADLQRGLKALGKPEALYAFSVGTEPLSDAGQFYFGLKWAFDIGIKLFDSDSVIVPIDSSRVCDINTSEDWARAELMYAKLKGLP